MPEIDLPHGTVRYREAGPDDAAAPPVVFVHGFLVNGSLWSTTADALATRGLRSYAPDWPLGSHPIALGQRADQSPRGVARQILAFLEAKDLRDVTLVGNDTGGAICQFVIDTDASRIGRLVLTNCDAFEVFPPRPFDILFKAFRSAALVRAAVPGLRIAALRNGPLGFGPLVREPLDSKLTAGWADPIRTNPGVRADTVRFARGVDPKELEGVSGRLGAFAGPSLLVWGNGDRFFKVELGRRLAAVLADSRLVEIDGGRTFVPHDHPERLASEIAEFAGPYAAALRGHHDLHRDDRAGSAHRRDQPGPGLP